MKLFSTNSMRSIRVVTRFMFGVCLITSSSPLLAEVRVWKLAELTDFNAMPVAELTGSSIATAEIGSGDPSFVQVQQDRSVAFKLNDLMNSQSLSIGDLVRGDLRPKKTQAQPAVVAKSLSLKIQIERDRLRFSPARLESDSAGADVRMILVSAEGKEINLSRSGLRMFVRDPSIASFEKGLDRLKLKSSGRTEVYVLNGDKMFIVPVSVGGSVDRSDSIKIPTELVSLDGFIADNSFRSASIGFGSAPGTENRSEVDSEEVESDDNKVADETDDELRSPALMNQSESVASGLLSFGLRSAPREGRYRDVNVQIVDDRSTTDKSRSYPVANARVTVVGVGAIGRTDARGAITIQDVPRAANIAIIIDHEDGLIVPQLAAVPADGGAEGRRIGVLRESFFDLATRAAGVTQLNFKSSLCLNLRDARSNGLNPLANIQIKLDQDSEGPFYFNQYGLIDARLAGSGPDGRACFFNVEPGVVTVTAFYQGQAIGSGLTALVAAAHREDDFDLFGSSVIRANIAALTTSHEQLGSDGSLNDSLRKVEFLNLSFAGESEYFAAVDSGMVSFDGEVNFLNDRAVVFGQDGDFELTSYSLGRSEMSETVNIPLVPRGFVEDMAVYADVAFDPNLGSVMTQFYGAPVGSDIRFRAVPLAVDRDAIEGWTYDQYPVAKAMFFNLEPGAYAVITETSEGHWLNYQVVEVYSETLSFIHNSESLGGFRALQP
jgi:hypothetical protein